VRGDDNGDYFIVNGLLLLSSSAMSAGGHLGASLAPLLRLFFSASSRESGLVLKSKHMLFSAMNGGRVSTQLKTWRLGERDRVVTGATGTVTGGGIFLVRTQTRRRDIATGRRAGSRISWEYWVEEGEDSDEEALLRTIHF
jgi:hypothetical protein